MKATALLRAWLVLASLILGLFARGVWADEVVLMKGVTPAVGEKKQEFGDKFKKKGPWKIGMSHFGLSNSWSIQMASEAQFAAESNPNVAKFFLRDAELSTAKQFTDINDLIDQGVDALIVTPLTPTSAEPGIRRALAAGIPVIVHTGLTGKDEFTVEIQGGGVYFGKVMGDWLVHQLKGSGAIWELRGVPRHPEDINRNRGLMDALKDTDVHIRLGGYGDWSYKGGRTLCKELYQVNPDVDGIWSSGADMARGCIDSLKELHAAIPPITGEGNNGFFKEWRDNKLTAIAPEFGPELGAAGVRAAIAILEGKSLYKHYAYNPPPITLENRDKYLRDDLADEYWFPSALSEDKKKALYGSKKPIH